MTLMNTNQRDTTGYNVDLDMVLVEVPNTSAVSTDSAKQVQSRHSGSSGESRPIVRSSPLGGSSTKRGTGGYSSSSYSSRYPRGAGSIPFKEEPAASGKSKNTTTAIVPSSLKEKQLNSESTKLVLPLKKQQRTKPVLAFCQFIFTILLLIAGAWAAYGVSVQSNLGFWKQTFQTEISFVMKSFPNEMLNQE